MNIEILPLTAFVLIATFTPGPGNITSAAMGMMYGFGRTRPFLGGIVCGYLLIMILCAFLSNSLLLAMPAAEPVLRTIGALYILRLAVATMSSSYTFHQRHTPAMSFKHGFLLQALNPKAIIFGLTIYSTFLSRISGQPILLTVSTFVLACVTLCSVSLWAFTGVQIQGCLTSLKTQKMVNMILSALLIYCAISLSGVLSFLT